MKNILISRVQIIKQLFRFGIVGGLSTLLNSVMFLILVNWLVIQPLLANILAFLSAFLISYFGHSWWTFADKQHNKKKLIRFLASSLLGLTINSSFVWLIMHALHQSAYIATLPMIFITPLLIFCINKSWVFKNNPAIANQRTLS